MESLRASLDASSNGFKLMERLEPRQLMSADVLTYHNDLARTGANLTETILTPGNVNAQQFGKLFSLKVDGAVYAQPLVMQNVKSGGKTRTLVFVATEADSVYAFDAATGKQVWYRNFTDKKHGIEVPSDNDVGSADIGTQNSITATPVIDPATGTLYVVTKEENKKGNAPFGNPADNDAAALTRPDDPDDATDINLGANYYQIELRALDVSTGANKFGGSTMIRGSVPGAGEGQEGPRGDPHIPFNALRENARAGLLLLNGMVYISFGSHGDNDPYHGWLFGYDAKTLSQKSILNFSPDGLRGPIWQGGAAPAADANGNIFAATGNGTFDVPLGAIDYSDSALRISTSNGTLTIADYFTPKDEAKLQALDLDLGSNGVVLLDQKDANGNTVHELLTADKRGRLYLLNRDNLGKFNISSDAAIQEIDAFGGTQIYSTPAIFNGKVYISSVDNPLKAFDLMAGKLSSAPTSQSSENFGFPGTTPSVSANGHANGIVWAIERQATTPDLGASGGRAILHAYDAANLSHELYSAGTNAARDIPGGGPIKFSVPTIANGEVFLGTTNSVAVFGLLGAQNGKLAAESVNPPTVVTDPAKHKKHKKHHHASSDVTTVSTTHHKKHKQAPSGS